MGLKLKEFMRWLLTTAGEWALLYLAVAHGVGGAQNLLVAWLWFGVLIVTVAGVGFEKGEWKPEKMRVLTNPFVPLSARNGVEFAFAAVLVWLGWWMSAAAVLYAVAGMAVIRDKARKLVAAQPKAA